MSSSIRSSDPAFSESPRDTHLLGHHGAAAGTAAVEVEAEGAEMEVVGDQGSPPAHHLPTAKTSANRNLEQPLVVEEALVGSGQAWPRAVQRATSLPIVVSRERGHELFGRAGWIMRMMIAGLDHRQEAEVEEDR